MSTPQRSLYSPGRPGRSKNNVYGSTDSLQSLGSQFDLVPSRPAVAVTPSRSPSSQRVPVSTLPDPYTPPERPHRPAQTASFLTSDPFATPPSRSSPVFGSSSARSSIDEGTRPAYNRQRTQSTILRDAASQIMTSHLYKQGRSQGWFSEDANVANGVAIRLAKSSYMLYPADDPRLGPFEMALNELNAECAITCSGVLVEAVTNSLVPSTRQVTIAPGESIQVVDSMEELGGARKAQNACFIRLERKLVVWADAVLELPSIVEALEQKMVKYVWKMADQEEAPTSRSMTSSPSMASLFASPKINRYWGGDAASDSDVDSFVDFNEKSADGLEPDEPAKIEERKTMYFSPAFVGLGVALNIFICSMSAKRVMEYTLLDGQMWRLSLLSVLPVLFCLLLFCMDTIVGAVMQILAPIRQMSQNTQFYSGKRPQRITSNFPHVTVVAPVYKEGLKEVLMPTFRSIQKAISTYELQGGTASILVCEDGMQLISEEEQEVRRDYYDRQNIAWVARPPHTAETPRKGRFKKSSNMNVAKSLSLRVEELMNEKRPTLLDMSDWTAADEDALYEMSLDEALAAKEGRVWASGNIRMGDYLLIIDSDTRVPEDCILDSVSEMEQSPNVGVLQHCSGTFLADGNFFEVAIAYFTLLVNFSISWSVAAGASAPFMGHNAFLNWRALQLQATVAEDGSRLIWSEDHVSEDFVLTMSLFNKGYITRWATYCNSEFLEGVSLSCEDELNRWQKYAYGCSEIVFNPLHLWFTKGPISGLFMTFLRCNIPIHAKFSIISYIFSYWAIACAIPLNTAFFFIQGWLWDTIHRDMVSNSQIFFMVLVCFTVLGGLGTIIARYRAKHTTLFKALFKHLCYVPFFFCFFGGVSWHVMTALGAHITHYNMSWSATKKELEDSTVFKEIPAIFKRFWALFLFCVIMIAGIVVLTTPLIPVEWQILDPLFIFPTLLMLGCHILYPFVLNPWVMLLSF